MGEDKHQKNAMRGPFKGGSPLSPGGRGRQSPGGHLHNVLLKGDLKKPCAVNMEVNGEKVVFELDIGCSVTLMNNAQFKKTWINSKCPELKKTSLELKTYTGEQIRLFGVAEVKVEYHKHQKTLPLLVVEGIGPSWLEKNPVIMGGS